MNSLRLGMNKLRVATPLLKQQKRNFAYGYNHIIAGKPTVRWSFTSKMTMAVTYVSLMLSYPLYVVYMMPKWDEMDVPPSD